MNIKKYTSFTGPVFIIGMPRSGTKLLRDLLNRHPHVGIPNIETNFLPNWVRNWQHYGDLSKRSMFKKFYRKMLHLSYFAYMGESGDLIKDDIWFNMCINYTPAGVFEALIRHDAEVEYDSVKIWGDKSPSYIEHIPLLKEIYPRSRFIHIIRDVRDYCLSINKAWGKNMIRAAQRWSDSLQNVKNDSGPFLDDYLEIKYEDLITKPNDILKKVCDFLDLKFLSQIVSLTKPSENLGDAKGLREIKKDNKNKYCYLMENKLRNEIEAIAAPSLKIYGYNVDVPSEHKKINSIKMFYYKLFDGVNLFRFTLRERGIFNAFRWRLNAITIKKYISFSLL